MIVQTHSANDSDTKAPEFEAQHTLVRARRSRSLVETVQCSYDDSTNQFTEHVHPFLGLRTRSGRLCTRGRKLHVLSVGHLHGKAPPTRRDLALDSGTGTLRSYRCRSTSCPAPSLLVCKLLTPSLVASHYYTEEPFAGPYPCKNYASKDSPLLSPGQTEGCRSR